MRRTPVAFSSAYVSSTLFTLSSVLVQRSVTVWKWKAVTYVIVSANQPWRFSTIENETILAVHSAAIVVLVRKSNNLHGM